MFSPHNLPQLAYAICNLFLYLFCNCKITNKVFWEFCPNFMGKQYEEWSGEILSCSITVFELPGRAKNFLSDWFMIFCLKISTAKPLAWKLLISANRHPSQCPLLQNMQCQSPLLTCLISLKSNRCKSSIFIKRSTNLFTLV